MTTKRYFLWTYDDEGIPTYLVYRAGDIWYWDCELSGETSMFPEAEAVALAARLTELRRGKCEAPRVRIMESQL